MRDTNASRSLLYHHRVSVATRLVDAVAHSDECVRLVCRPGVGAATLLDQAEAELFSHRLRCVRVDGSASGGLPLKDLITQVVGRADPDALRDCDLEAGFVALTEPGEGYDRVVLLVDEAHNLQPSAVHYVQFACQSSPKLRVVLAGQPSLDVTLANDKFAYLRQRVTRTLELPDPTQDKTPNLLSELSKPASVPATFQQDRSWPWLTVGAAVPVVVVLVLSMGAMGWLHLPRSPVAATPANVPALDDQAALIRAGSKASAVDAPIAQPEAAKRDASRANQPPAEAAPPGVVNAPNPAEAAASQERTEAASMQVERASQPVPEVAPKPAPKPAPAPERAAAAIPLPVMADPAVKQGPASLGVALDALPPERPVEAIGGARIQDKPPISVPPVSTPTEQRIVGPTQGAEPEALHMPASDAAQPVLPTAIAAGPPAPPRPQLRTSAVAVLSPEASSARHLRPGTERAAAPVAALPVNSADERRCRDIVLYAQLGKTLSDADKHFLRDGCRAQ